MINALIMRNGGVFPCKDIAESGVKAAEVDQKKHGRFADLSFPAGLEGVIVEVLVIRE